MFRTKIYGRGKKTKGNGYLDDTIKDISHGEGRIKGRGFGEMMIKLLSYLPESTRNNLASRQYAKRIFGKDSNSFLKKIPIINDMGQSLRKVGLGVKRKKRVSRKKK